jgi:hypothetical protein
MPNLIRPDLLSVIKLMTLCLNQSGKAHEEGPQEWVGATFRVEAAKESPLSDESHVRRSDDLPSIVYGFRLDGKPVLVGDISAAISRKDLLDTVRRYRNQAMITRSWLGPEATSVSLFLIGPMASDLDQTWHDWALEIELDEKVCRKIVWLLSSSPGVEEAARFLEGTSLAQPWKHAENIGAERLDSLAQLGLPAAWLAVISDEELNTDEVVGKLIEAGREVTADAE